MENFNCGWVAWVGMQFWKQYNQLKYRFHLPYMFSLNLKSYTVVPRNDKTLDRWSRLEAVHESLSFASKGEKWVGLIEFCESKSDLEIKNAKGSQR